MSFKLFCIYISIGFLFANTIVGQEDLKFIHYNKTNGLPIHSLDNVLKDSDGFLWVSGSSNKSIVRFDSYQFLEYKFNGVTKILFEDTINNKKVLILSISDTLHQFSLRDFSCTSILNNKGGKVESIFVIRSPIGDYRIGNRTKIYSFNPETGESYDEHKLKYSSIVSWKFDPNNKNLWIISHGHIQKHDLNNKLIKEYGLKIKVSDLFLINLNSIAFFRDDQILEVYDPELDAFISSKIKVINDESNPQFNRVVKYNNRFFLTSSFGIYLFDNNDKYLYRYKSEESNPFSLPTDLISGVFIDDQSILWIGTYQKGLSKCNLLGNNFKIISKGPNSLPDEIIECIEKDKNGHFWIGTMSKGLVRYIPDKNIFQYIPSFKGNEPGVFINTINTIDFEDENIIWLGSINFGLFKVDISELNKMPDISGDITKYCKIQGFFPLDEEPEKSLCGWSVKDVYIDADKDLWVATFNGLGKYSKGIWTSYFSKFNKDWDKKKLQTIEIYEDPDIFPNILFIGIEHEGLYYLEKESGKQGKIVFDEELLKIEQIVSVGDDTLWLLSNDLYLVEIDIESESGKVLKKIDLDDVETNRISFDNQTQMWIATDNGMLLVNPEGTSVSVFDEKDGLPSSIISWSMFDEFDNTMYLTTNKGIAYYNPEEVKIQEDKTPVCFTRFKRYGKEVHVEDTIEGKVLLNDNLNQLDNITLRHIDNDFSLEFAALAFSNNHNIRYAYRLDGYDSDWRYCDPPSREAAYSNLPVGKYELTIRKLDQYGMPEVNGTNIKIEILPAWWATWLFRIIVLITIALCVIFVYQMRIRNMKARQKELEIQVKERTKEIELQKEELHTQKDEIEAQSEELMATMEDLHNANNELEKVNSTKDKFFSIIAHDLKNPFHAISGFASLLNKSFRVLEEKKKIEFISMIETSSKNASALLENLLTWSRSQTNKVQFEPQEIKLSKIVNDTYGLLEVNATRKKIELISKVDENHIAFADANMLTTIIRNLVNNALKFTNEGGKITISTSIIEKEMCLAIADTGVGMTEEVKNKLFKIDKQHTTQGTSGEAGTGLGLIICQEFIEKNNGKIEVESEVGKGSKFMIYLPRK